MNCELARLMDCQQVQVISDGYTVWVNGRDGLISRFGMAGIDIHKSLVEQESGNECLFCTHGRTTIADWELFKQKMLELYGATISDEHRPMRLQRI